MTGPESSDGMVLEAPMDAVRARMEAADGPLGDFRLRQIIHASSDVAKSAADVPALFARVRELEAVASPECLLAKHPSRLRAMMNRGVT